MATSLTFPVFILVAAMMMSDFADAHNHDGGVPTAKSRSGYACAEYCESSVAAAMGKCNVECAPSKCDAQQINIKGDVIIMDITGDNYSPRSISKATTPLGCCAACEVTDGCNAWVLCTNKKGCGSGCKANTVGAQSNDFTKRLGTFHSCTADDKYPYQMCSLKIVDDIAKPAVHPNGAEEGWVSGAVKKEVPSNCGFGITAATCKMCKSTYSFLKCAECAKTIPRVGVKDECGLCGSLSTTEQRFSCFKVASRLDSVTGCYNLRSGGKLTLPLLQTCFDELDKKCSQSKHPATCKRCFDKAGARINCVDCANLPSRRRSSCVNCLVKGKENCV